MSNHFSPGPEFSKLLATLHLDHKKIKSIPDFKGRSSLIYDNQKTWSKTQKFFLQGLITSLSLKILSCVLIVGSFRIQEDGSFVRCVTCQVPPTPIQVTKCRRKRSVNYVLNFSLILQDWKHKWSWTWQELHGEKLWCNLRSKLSKCKK